MRNYYDVLGINRLTPSASVKQTLLSTPAEHLEDEDDLQSILESDQMQSHYKRVHLQYDAIAAALSNPALINADTQSERSHQWDKRAVEFEPEQNTIELSR